MTRRSDDATFRAGLSLLGAVLLASGALAFDLARGHIAELASLCGGADQPHCAWCYAAAAFAAAGVSALIAAARPARAAACAGSKSSFAKPAS